MVAHNTGSTVTCSVIKLAYYNLKLYELEIYDLIVAKVALKVYRYRYRHRGKSLFTYRLLTELKIPLPYISDVASIVFTVPKWPECHSHVEVMRVCCHVTPPDPLVGSARGHYFFFFG